MSFMDAVDHFNHIYDRLSAVERTSQLHGYREKITMDFDMADIFVPPLLSTPEQPHFDAYIAQLSVGLTKPVVAVPALFEVLKGNFVSGTESQVWWAPLVSGKWAAWLFPTPQYQTASPYGVIAGAYQVSPPFSPDAGDYFRFGITQPGDGGVMTVYIDWVPSRALAPA